MNGLDILACLNVCFELCLFSPLTHLQPHSGRSKKCSRCFFLPSLFIFFADDSRPRFSSSRVAVTVGSLLDDQHWHSVHVERFNKQVNLTVDAHTQHFRTKGEGNSLEVDYEVSSCDDWLT